MELLWDVCYGTIRLQIRRLDQGPYEGCWKITASSGHHDCVVCMIMQILAMTTHQFWMAKSEPGLQVGDSWGAFVSKVI